MSEPRPSVAIVGPGRVGRALAGALERAGHEVVALVGRRDDAGAASRADIVLITVPDDDIAAVFERLASSEALVPSQVVFHCSGLVASSVLEVEGFVPAGRAAVHPLMAFADVERAHEALPGTTYGVEGDERGLEEARRMVQGLGGRMVEVPAGAKAAYHLACVMASNGLVALTDAAVEIARTAGVSDDALGAGLSNLVSGTAGNMSGLGIRQAMTGPVVRGDSASVARHIEILKASHPEILVAYRPLMRRLVMMAIESGRGEPGRYAGILELLED